MGYMHARLACGIAAIAACGRIGFDATGGASDAIDSNGLPPSPHVGPDAIVDTAGIAVTSNEVDGTHLVFVDNTPGKNGNLVIFRQGDDVATIKAYVSTDGVQWTRYILTPGNASGINAMGGCQDSTLHAFHLTWMDSSVGDQYTRWTPTYTGGDITGFTLAAAFQFFNDTSDSPGPRDLQEIVDGNGARRLLFAGTSPASATDGLYKLAVTTPTVGVAPASQNDWAPATDHTKVSTTDQLLANNVSTTDVTTTFMETASSNIAGGPTAPIVVVAGLPSDRRLIAWTITPRTTSDFTISAPQTISQTFGGGTGARGDATLSLASAPSGDALFVYNEDATSSAPGLHVAALTVAGALVIDRAPQPSVDTNVRHAVIATDSASRPAVLYADPSGRVVGTLLFAGAWLPTATVASLPTAAGAWSITNVWRPGGQDTFGVYRDDGASVATTFSRVYWR
jgi:hypothetical protein